MTDDGTPLRMTDAASADAASSEQAQLPTLVLDPDREALRATLARAALLILRHPVAAQAGFAALVAEGKRFAETPEGKTWKAALMRSDLVEGARHLWEGSILNFLEEDGDVLLPTAIVDAVVQAATRTDLTDLLRHLFDGSEFDDAPHA